MKIYVASSFPFIQEVDDVADWLKKRGHQITCEWWHTDYKDTLEIQDNDLWYGHPIIKTIYQRSLNAIRESDLLIFVSPRLAIYNGANVEIGIALEVGIPVVGYGQLHRSAMYEPVIRCGNFTELSKVMLEFEEH